MRIRHAAGLSAAVISAVVGLPLPAVAAEPAAVVLYVGGGICKNDGPGTQALPVCTVQAAADRALPGQTVEVSAGTYPEAVTVRHSGEPGKPITFRSTGHVGMRSTVPGRTNTFPVIAGPQKEPVRISGQHDIVFSGFEVTHFELDGVSRVELSGNWIEQRDDKIARPAVAVTGASDHVRIERSVVRGTTGGVQVGAGIAGTVIAGNDFVSSFKAPAIAVTDAPGTVITHNTTNVAPGVAIDLAGSSDHATITSNVVATSAVQVSAGSTDGTVLDYNTVWSFLPERYPSYRWADAAYKTATELQAATGQGQHDANGSVPFDLGFSPLSVPQSSVFSWQGRNAIDSAGPEVPGVPDVDLLGHGPFDHPDVPNTGPNGGFRDRGAYEAIGALSASLTVTPENDFDPLAVMAHANPISPSRITGYSYDFGDGTTTPPSNRTSERHVYAKPGTYTVRMTFSDEFGTTRDNSTNVTVDYAPSGYTAIAPTRILDTRQPGRYRLGPDETIDLDVRNRVSGSAGNLVPLGATAVVVNLTATQGSATSHLDVYPSAAARPSTSNVNFGPGQDVANLVTVPVGPNGTVVIRNNSGYVHVIADVLGYFTAGSTDRFAAVAPARLLDTRSDNTPLTSGNARRLKIAGTGGVPANATSAVLNVTATDSASAGFVAVYPGGTQRPAAGSNLNTVPGRNIANQVVVPLGADGSVEVFTNASRSHLVVDVSGYYGPDGKGLFTPVTPTRLLDSRNGSPFAPFSSRTVEGVRYGSTAAVVNLTATGTVEATHLTAWATGTAKPGTSNLNASPGLDVPNHTTIPVDGQGRFDIANNAGTTHVIADLFGYYRNQ
ncbi:PKD domain-containing protein [Kitasatospora sp. NPDC056783]|uniref:PKD domain-containing protein n=1 Tax=Kitasatospora sp. NPDC056783 TaxID=3345943 RepID=UPI0036B13356